MADRFDVIVVGARCAGAGAEVMMASNVNGLVRDGRRVVGVKATHRGQERELRARLVVGSDGRNSTVAELVGARKYNVTPGERFGYWGFFADANPGPEPVLLYHRWEGRFVIAMPTDGGLYEVVVLPDPRFLPKFKHDREAAFLEHARAWLATDFGAPGVAPSITVEILRRLQRRDQLDEVGDVLQHRAMPSTVFTPTRLLAATAAHVAKPGVDRRQALRELRELVVTDTRRRRLLAHPEFVAPAQHRHVGETEVSEELAA
jgi:2-polyprenyl-6-methoxyphenol hydroxylase-like FAD-dependent oxidoreductase